MNMKSIRLRAHEVQGILDGRQTQTRRIVKAQIDHECWVGTENGPVPSLPDWSKVGIAQGKLWCGNCGWLALNPLGCPYGKTGDVLYVRETWAKTTNVNSLPNWPGRPHLLLEDGYCIIYKADDEWQWVDDDGFSTEKSYWKPSIHMPKEAARIFLRITDIRVERLQDISEEDCLKEGIESVKVSEAAYHSGTYGEWFRELWQSINGPESWEANPWVWVVSFERTEKPTNQ